MNTGVEQSSVDHENIEQHIKNKETRGTYMNHSHYVVATPGQAEQGFTMIELMITVVIVAILAAVAIPSYMNHVIKTKRAAAEGFMLNVANKQEQYVLDARTYTATLGAGGLGLTVPQEVSPNYDITIPTATTTTYTITATPIGGQLANDTTCGTLTLDQAGAKAPTTGCW